MKFELKETYIVPTFTEEDEWSSDEWFKNEDQLNSIGTKCDLARVTLKDGTSLILTSANFHGGQCGCCSSFSGRDISKIERFVEVK